MKSEPLETAASLAIAAVGALRPSAAKTRVAAAMIALRLSSLFGLAMRESYKSVVKLTFFKGASLSDPSGLFNSSLDGKVRRAIDIREEETIDEAALKALIREAVALNQGSKRRSA